MHIKGYFITKNSFVADVTFTEKLQNRNFINILRDGSTNFAVIEKECIYVLFADPETFHLTISFFPLRDRLSQDAERIFSALK